MKKIGIDGRLYSQTGVGVYIKNLIFYLEKQNIKDTVFYLYLMDQDFDKVSFKSDNFVKKRANYLWHSFSEQIGFLKTLNEDNLDLMHFTYFSYPIFYKRPFITTIHDLTPLLFKTGKSSTRNSFIYSLKHFVFKRILFAQVRNSQAIITPTMTVKKQIVQYYGTKYEQKVYPIYEGINYQLISSQTGVNSRIPVNVLKPFFIYVGNFYPHKNVENLIKAFSNVTGNYKLVLIGPKDFFTQRILRCINSLKQDKKIIVDTQASLNDLIFYYKNASALIHPSFSEGFGLPIIESVYFNLPIIGSNIEVFNELLGDEYISFNPKKIEDMVDKINAFVNRPVKFNYSKLMEKYSFEKMTRETLGIYQRLLS